MPDIRIVPANAIMSFTSSLNFIQKITQDVSGSLNLYGSGSTGRTEILSVDGNNGRLFTVSDDLSDSLFSVNTIAGLPVIEAFANNSVNIGQYSAPPIKVTGSLAIITGSLLGTASYATQALSASWAPPSTSAATASFVTSSNVYGPNGSNSILSASSAISSSITTNLSGGSVVATGIYGTTLNIAGNGASADPYGTIALTQPANSTNYSYYGLTRAGNIGAGFGITGTTGALGLGQNAYWFGTATAGLAGTMSTAWLAFNGTSLVAVGTISGSSFTGAGTGLTGTASSLNIGGNAATATSASMASLVAVTSQDTTPVTYNLTFVGQTSGNASLAVDATTLTYNPNTGIFATNRISATSVTASLQGTASYASQAATASWATNVTNNGVTSVSASGTVSGITLGGGPITSTGTLTLSGTVSGLTNSNLSGTAGITNANLATPSLMIGTTNIALGATGSSLAGLTTVTATAFTGSFSGSHFGPLTGTASYATNALTASTAVSTPNAFTLGGSPFVGYVPYANANLTFTNSGIYYSSTNIGVGTTSMQGKLHVYQSTNLGGTAGNSLILQSLQNTGGSGGNNVYIKDYAVRDATGTDWTTWRHHNSIDIDGSHNTPGTNTKTFWERDPLAGVHYFGNSATTTLTVDATNNSVGIGAGPETGVALIATVSNNAFGSTAVLNNTSTGTSALSQLQFRTANQTSTPFIIHQFNNGAAVALTNVANANLTIGTNNTTRVTITNGGAMGLGGITPTNTNGRFEASNDIVAYSSSDKNWKTNIKNIDSPLEKISQINGVEFDWIEDEPVHGNKGHDIGVIAQEIEQILPEAVQTRESGMKAVKYEKVIPLLIEAIKDQQKQIEQLKQIVNGFTK